MGEYREIIITPYELNSDDILVKKVVLRKPNNILINGIVIGEDNKPIVGAILVLTKEFCVNNILMKENSAFTFTNINGEYAFVIKEQFRVNYKITIFEPMV